MKKDYLIVGNFDSSKYNLKYKTTTNEVILTKNRVEHIAERHPEILKHLKDLKFILKDPDIILRENNKIDTIWIVKELEDNVKITLKLNTVKYGIKDYKNSIIQMQYLDNSKIERYIRNKRVTKLFAKEKVM